MLMPHKVSSPLMGEGKGEGDERAKSCRFVGELDLRLVLMIDTQEKYSMLPERTGATFLARSTGLADIPSLDLG